MEAWFDGDLSECYYSWGHVNKTDFCLWIWKEDPDYGCPGEMEIEYLWAKELDEERFSIVPKSVIGAKPISRFRP